MLFDPVQRAIEIGGDAGLVVDLAGVVVAAVVGSGQILAIWYGLRQMQKASADRDRQSERRHVETMQTLADERERGRAMMRALETLIERTAPPPREAAG